MSDRLGRNPFEKTRARKVPDTEGPEPLVGVLIDLADDLDEDFESFPSLSRLLAEIPGARALVSLKDRVASRLIPSHLTRRR